MLLSGSSYANSKKMKTRKLIRYVIFIGSKRPLHLCSLYENIITFVVFKAQLKPLHNFDNVVLLTYNNNTHENVNNLNLRTFDWTKTISICLL